MSPSRAALVRGRARRGKNDQVPSGGAEVCEWKPESSLEPEVSVLKLEKFDV